MIVNTSRERNLVSVTRDFVTNQHEDNIIAILNTGGIGFDVTEGYGEGGSSTSTAFVLCAGGFPDQRITATMKYVAPTSKGSEDLGVLGRFFSWSGANDEYYYARCDAGDAEIIKVKDGTFSTLASTPFALDPDVLVTITFTLQGNDLEATFSAASGPGDVTLTVSDSDIPQAGLMGARSLTSTMWVRTITGEQL